MNETDQKIIDTSLDQLRAVHDNMGRLWDAESMATFYYSVLSGTIARNGPEVARAITAMLTEVFDNAARSHTNLGRLGGNLNPSMKDISEAGSSSTDEKPLI